MPMPSLSKRIREYLKLIIVSMLIGALCNVLANSLKAVTEHYEGIFYKAAGKYWILYFLFPALGLTLIHFLRRYFFNNKENKGIKEIYATLKTRKNQLPIYKIPSHYLNGLLTVVFGGSTGIEVSTVVASATIGHVAQKQGRIHTAFRKELIYAGVGAGIAALFNSPLAGIIFSLEVISRRASFNAILSVVIAVGTAWGINFFLHEDLLFTIHTSAWTYHALPYFIVLGIIAGFNAVYLTRCVLLFKRWFARLNKYSFRIAIAAVIMSATLFFFPQLYGDGYHAMKTMFLSAPQLTLASCLVLALAMMVLKPLVTSAALGAGGDGGVFAPSLFIGAFLGLLIALLLNSWFHVEVIPVNFMVIGMAAVLSASLHAPFTAMFLVCGLVGNYGLILPICIACFVSKYTAKWLYPYTVYTYVPAVAPEYTSA